MIIFAPKQCITILETMITITFPDKSVREFQEGVTGLQVAENISGRLAREALCISVNGDVWDLNRPISENSQVELYTWNDRKGKEAFWHTSAHLMAEAIEFYYPGTKFGIGPSIETGFYYDMELPEGIQLTDNDLPTIEKKMVELARLKNPIVRRDVSKKEAIDFFTKKNDHLKLELISELEDGTITFYQQGNYTDLCKGPHLPNTGYIKAVKLTSIAGAYWRGDEKNKMLTRVYGVTFPKQKELTEYLAFLEEAKKRDHRKIGKEMELFMFSDKVGAGLPMWLPKGTVLRTQLEDFLKRVQKRFGYVQVMTPHIGSVDLYKTSGHYQKYGADSFQTIKTPEKGEEYMLKPMNCPHHCIMYGYKPHSYKELPIRIAEFGTVYRYEQSGELHGLTRVRGFTQDDAHIFCRPDQLKDEFKKVIDIIFIIFKAMEMKDYTAQISLRDPKTPEKYIGSAENWEKAERAIVEASAEKGLKTTTVVGEAAFYGPKLDFMVKDAIGRSWQLGTIQVDYNLPERFGLEYIGADDNRYRPIMIHRAPFGSMERFVAVLIENTAGKFPLWLTPDQVVVLPISEKYNDYAKKVSDFLNNSDIRTIIDDRDEKIGRKVRDNELKRIPYMLVVGEKEMNSGEVSVRKQGKGDEGSMTIEKFATMITDLVKEQQRIDY